MKQTDTGRWKAFWREPSGAQRSKTFAAKKEANTFLANVEVSKSTGVYVSPHAGRTMFGDHARPWMASWNIERTTAARDRSIMLNHVLPQWDTWQLGKIDHLSVQNWLTRLSQKLSPATVAQCKRLMSGVMASAVKNRLIGADPTVGVKLPARRVRDTDERIISREELRTVLLPVVPARYRRLVLTAAFTGMRWGETVGLCVDALDLDKRIVTVIRTVTEVAGHTEFKPYPKSRAGRRKIPVPSWLAEELREHLKRYPPSGQRGLVFSNEVGGPLRRTLFRSRVWRPSLVRAGLLGEVGQVVGGFEAVWMDAAGEVGSEVFSKYDQAVRQVARHEHGGLRFHDLRHCYGTWLADDGLEPHKLARVMGHENSSTTMRLYVRRTEDDDAIRQLLGEDDVPGGAA